ncbi:hypothetical protein GGS23DRAFT_498193 [Durotheca rogersii]|uniref:uncharacterized protein n=1 Tax=Durotheca rogersii TaxID=419775 RepID=UPI002220EE3B|nr:uncharacterized protein GGS23DRAFT_498193 [Durotheca rogersii]KAI5864405.1 hypothetical protein GGS23DRAFT_498193 [Durotheca rogersii]
MPFDDEDPAPVPPSDLPGADVEGEDEDALEDGDGTRDFRMFTSLLQQPGSQGRSPTPVSGRTLRRGEKDFEAHGTRAQEEALEASRQAMHDVLSFTRTHKPRDYTRAWYFPDKWADVPPASGDGEGGGEREGEGGQQRYDRPDDREKEAGLFARERVVAVEGEIKGPLGQNTGRVVTGGAVEKYRQTPGWLKTWLLPEEALYLVERGSLGLWWPARGIEDVFPVNKDGKDGDDKDSSTDGKLEDYELGIPLSLQAAYALLIGPDGERGKVSLEKYQVYSNLRRTGYRVMRATPLPLPQQPERPPQTVWERLFSLISAGHSQQAQRRDPPPYGPLVRPGLYRSYNPIFEQLYLVQRHRPTPRFQQMSRPSSPTLTPNSTTSLTPTAPEPEEPFKIHYHIWKSTTTFSKTKPGTPDFYIAVVNARTSDVPTLEQLTALLEGCTPWDPPPRDGNERRNGGGVGPMYRRLKQGYRNATVAVVDNGLISYLRFGEAAFGEERLYERFSAGAGGGGGKGKKGGRGTRGGRGGGRGGRGRGRGG